MTQKKNRQNVKYFSSTFFFLEEVFFFFFLWGVLMLRPCAASFWAHNRSQCADGPRLPALPIPTSSLGWRATNWALWEPPTTPASVVRLKHPPTVLPKTPATSHCTPLCSQSAPPPKRKKKNVSPSVWPKLDELDVTTSINIQPTD